MMNKLEIKKIIKKMKFKKNKLVLLHCISEYPTKLSNTQLGVITELKKTGYLVGFSDHTVGFEASIGAVCLGAKIIEKHITLDKKMGSRSCRIIRCKRFKKFCRNFKDNGKVN